MSGREDSGSITVKGATVTAIDGPAVWRCGVCGEPMKVGDRAYIGPDGVVHADPVVCPIPPRKDGAP